MNPILNLISAFGIIALCFIAWLGSENRRIIPWKTIISGIAIQLVVGVIVFIVLPQSDFLVKLNDLINSVLDASEAGARFLFGGDPSTFVPDPNRIIGPGPAGRWITRAVGQPYVAVAGDKLGPDNFNPGYLLAIRALPQVVFFSGLLALFYRLNWIQPVVNVCGKLFYKTMNLSGAEALSGAANIFVGIESMIAVKPFLDKMTRSEICAILAGCFGSIASSVLGLYAGVLRPVFPSIAGHLVTASIISIPSCFVMAKILVPETEVPETMGKMPEEPDQQGEQLPNPMDSMIIGALDGVKMAVGIAAVIIAILGVVAMLNNFFGFLGGLPEPAGSIFKIVSLQNIMGALFLPLTALTGVSLDWQELWQASVIIGRRLFETSIPPYIALSNLSASGGISDRAMLIVSYVLCGFTHFASYGIFIGGLAALIPHRRSEVSSLGFKALWAGTLSTFVVGCIAGLLDFGNPVLLGK